RSLKQLRGTLRKVRGIGPISTTTTAADLSSDSAWILRVLLGKEPLSAVRIAVGDSPDLRMLYQAVRDGGTKRRTKALVVLARRKGISLRRIARTLGRRGMTSVLRYWQTYRERGADHLLNAKTRMPSKTADESIRKALFKVLHSPPSVHGI